jgi:hypothetical protein
MSDSFDSLGRKRKTHCKHGHPFDGTEKWMVNWKGYKCRVCRECGKLRMRRMRENPDFLAKNAAATARWRRKNESKYRDGYRRQYRERDLWIQAFKTKCKYCEESRYPCLDFHHRDSDKKLATIAQVRHWSREKLQTEIEKCDVVCANCHRWHHWLEKKQDNISEGV